MKISELYEKINDGVIVSDIELQREIIYDDNKKSLVIDSIMNDIPLPAFYFWNNNGVYEVIDGKQRIEAIKKFKQNNLQYKDKIWMEYSNVPGFQDKFNNTDLTIIECSGTEEQKREIFRRINTLGVPLSQYEVLNGLYNGEYLRGLTKYVTQDKNAIKVLGTQSRGSRQMKVLKYLLSLRKDDSIDEYVKAQKDKSFQEDQKEISKYLEFIAKVFDEYSKVDIYFNLSKKYLKDITIWKTHKDEINKKLKLFYKSNDYKLIDEKEQEIEDIIQTVVKGISVDPKRLFTQDDKKEYLSTREKSDDGKYQCEKCMKWFYPEELQMDHDDPWSKGGRTVLSNAKILCPVCNRNKSNIT